MSGDPYGTRTRVFAVKGRCPRPLDEGVTGDECLLFAEQRVKPLIGKNNADAGPNLPISIGHYSRFPKFNGTLT